MRVTPHEVGSIVHITKCGARGMNIVRDNHDRYDFVRSIFLLNDLHQDNNWRSYTATKPLFYRPESWPERKPLTSILAWTLLDNHFHILAQEITEGGIAKFMQRLGGSITTSFNNKYGGRGTIFQGGYKGRVIADDEYLHYVNAYIVAKNTFDMFPGGVVRAATNFEKAWRFAHTYPFTSFLTSTTGAESPILDMSAIDSLGLIRKEFKTYVQSMLSTHTKAKGLDEKISDLLLEEW